MGILRPRPILAQVQEQLATRSNLDPGFDDTTLKVQGDTTIVGEQ